MFAQKKTSTEELNSIKGQIEMFVWELYGAIEFQDGRLLDEIYDFWDKQDEQSIYLRFGRVRPPRRSDYEKSISHVQVVMFVRDNNGKLIGYSEGFCFIDNERHVDLGVAVDKQYQCNGVATEMTRRVCLECARQGIEKAEAFIITDNLPMRTVVKRVMDQFPGMQKFEGGNIHVLFDLTASN